MVAWCALAIASAASDARAVPTIDTYVGGGNGDGNLAINAALDPRGFIAVGSATSPDFYVADGRNNLVRRVDGASGLIETVAGNGVQGFGGDGGSARNASLSLPLDVALDGAGNLYIADMQNNRIRKVTPAGVISTFAGDGTYTYGGDGGLATQAGLKNPYAVAVGPDGYIYIADFGNNRIRRVGPPGCSPSTCVISTVVGTGDWSFSGDGGAPLNASLKNPADVAFDNSGGMLIVDYGNKRIRKVSNGIITTVAGGGFFPDGSVGDGGPATAGVLLFPMQVAADTAGNLFIADSSNRRVRMVQASNQFIYTIAGDGGPVGSTGDGGPAVNATIYTPYGVAAVAPGTMWFSQNDLQANKERSRDNRIRRISNGIITSVIGGGLGDGGQAYDAIVGPTSGQAKAGNGPIANLYFADGGNNVARFVDGATGEIITLAGSGTPGYSGDNGPALEAALNAPNDVAVDSNGVVYIADTGNNAVRRVRNGIIDTVAGTGRLGYSGDGGLATAAQLNSPTGVAVDASNRLYIADQSNNRIRRVASNGIITTVAGNGSFGYGGDGGAATSAMLRNPWDVVVRGDGAMFIADTTNHRIRYVDPNGTISTYAGLGYSGFAGDGGLATAALFNFPTSLDLDNNGVLYVNDSKNLRIRMIDNSLLHLISTVAGNGQRSAAGDGGPATAASFSTATGLIVDPAARQLFISSLDDRRVRIVSFDGAAPPTPTFTATAIPPTPTATSTPQGTSTRTATPQGTSTRTATPTKTNTQSAQTGTLSGSVAYYSNAQKVSGVSVGLVGPSTINVSTNSNGQYSTTVALGTWNVQPSKSGGFGSAVSSLDAARVLQALAGIQQFTNQQRLACDASGDGSLSTLDAVYILQFSAGLIDQLPAARTCGSDWLFYPSPSAAQNQLVIYPSLGGGNCQQGSIVLNPLVGSASGQSFDGILLGDCTGNWTSSMALRQRAAGGAVVHAGAPRRSRGDFVVPVYVKSAALFQSLDLRLSYDSTATFVGASVRGEAAAAITSAQGDGERVSLSLASARPLAGNRGSILLLRFRGANPDLALDGAMVDEQVAQVVTHRRTR